MTGSLALFYAYSAVALAGAVGLVAARRLVHAVMSLFATLVAIAAIYLLMGSDFLAAMQLFVYGGAVTVLVLFVLMLTRPLPETTSGTRRRTKMAAAAVCLALLGVLSAVLGRAQWRLSEASMSNTTASIAEILFSRYVLPFEIAGLVLTIAFVGAIVLARDETEPATRDVTEMQPVSGETLVAEPGEAV